MGKSLGGACQNSLSVPNATCTYSFVSSIECLAAMLTIGCALKVIFNRYEKQEVAAVVKYGVRVFAST